MVKKIETKKKRAAWQVYLAEQYDSDQISSYAAPARAQDYSDLPPAYSFVGTLDPFYDETLQYMLSLKDAGMSIKRKLIF